MPGPSFRYGADPGDAPGSATRLARNFEQLVDRYLCEVRGVDHDRVYKIGFIPVQLVREQLMAELERQYRPEWRR